MLFFCISSAAREYPYYDTARISDEKNKEITDSHIQKLLEASFLSTDSTERGGLFEQIEKESAGDFEKVVVCLKKLSVWKAISATGKIHAVNRHGSALAAEYVLPDNYDPKKSYPVLWIMPDVRQETLESLVEWIRKNVADFEEYVFVRPVQPTGSSFHCLTPEDPSDLSVLLREIHREIHVDRHRVFLFGIEDGGDAAWLAAMRRPDLFAGVVAIQAKPRLPYPNQSFPLFLSNLAPLHVMTAWGENVDETTDPGATAAVNRWIVDYGRKHKLSIAGQVVPMPVINSAGISLRGAGEGIPAPGVRKPDPTVKGHTVALVQKPATNAGSSEAAPPGEAAILQADALKELLQHQRPGAPKSVSLWFRYPAEGRIAWLRQTEYLGEPWTQDQLSVVPGPGVDGDAFITRALMDRLAFLRGTAEGQTLTIETRRCAKIEVLIGPDLVDLDRPVTIRVNGKRRHEGKIRPSLRTLLEQAFEDWDFDRPVLAKLPIVIHSETTPP